MTKRKPDPRGLLLATKEADASPNETYHVDDQPEDTEASRATNVVAIGMTWGIAKKTALKASKSDRTF